MTNLISGRGTRPAKMAKLFHLPDAKSVKGQATARSMNKFIEKILAADLEVEIRELAEGWIVITGLSNALQFFPSCPSVPDPITIPPITPPPTDRTEPGIFPVTPNTQPWPPITQPPWTLGDGTGATGIRVGRGLSGADDSLRVTFGAPPDPSLARGAVAGTIGSISYADFTAN